MLFNGLKIGFALTGSYCTLSSVLPVVEELATLGADITPILSEAVALHDTRFGKALDWKERMEAACGKKCIQSIIQAEPIGPKKLLDVLVIAPCTGNTIGKMANGITDSTVTMAAKAHARNQRPTIISISTNDGLSASAKNIGTLLNTKNVFLVPYAQDDPHNKASSLISKSELILPTIEAALKGIQLQPLLLV